VWGSAPWVSLTLLSIDIHLELCSFMNITSSTNTPIIHHHSRSETTVVINKCDFTNVTPPSNVSVLNFEMKEKSNLNITSSRYM
jgi:hypothetical protein